jgi:hypothetical protein
MDRTYDFRQYTDERLLWVLLRCSAEEVVPSAHAEHYRAQGFNVRTAPLYDQIYNEAASRGLDLTKQLYIPYDPVLGKAKEFK